MSSISHIEWTFDSPSIEIRLRPLREHWEARGPGMLRYANRLLPWISFPKTVRVHLVEPSGSGSQIKDGFIQFDAVLANPFPMLPEVVRLAWLLLCNATEADTNAQIGLIAVSIEAAEYVELARLDAPTINLALQEWRRRPSISDEELLKWWTANRNQPISPKSAWAEIVKRLAFDR